jgi:ABC-2 type transport system ATP-binding protein
MGSDSIIDVVGLKKSFGGTRALENATFQIERSENICVIGPNSAGKTTLLLLLGGAHYPNRGHVTIMGLHRWRNNFEIRQRSTFLTAEPVFGACPTPYEYLRFCAQIYGIDKQEFRKSVTTLCEEMNLLPHLDKPWHELSLGMKKKTGLVASFLPKVELRFLDEPFDLHPLKWSIFK